MARKLPRLSVGLCLVSLFILISKGAVELNIAAKKRCEHGTVTSKGNCDCKPCWTGDSCDVNQYHPEFDNKEYATEIKDQGDNVEPFFTPNLKDDDKESSCGKAAFSILDGNTDSLFTINPSTGSLTVSRGSYLSEDEYLLTISVRNSYDTSVNQRLAKANVRIKVVREDNHHIVKRSASSVVNNVTFDLTKKEPYTNTTVMKVGSRVRFLLTITFPLGTTDMLVELFTPDNDTTVMILCDVNVTSVGSGLTYTGSKIATMDASDKNSILYDRGIINFGDVTNSGCTVASECSIYIEYEAVMIDNSNTTAGGLYWVSAGAEYNNEDEVWVGQAAFTTYPNDTSVSDTPLFNFTGPGELAIGSSALFQVDMYLPNPSTNLNFDAFAPLNTSSVMSICSARIKYMSDNFKCGFDESFVSAQYLLDQDGLAYKTGRLSIGTLLNKGSRDDDNTMNDNLVTIEFTAEMLKDTSFIGQQYFVGSAFEIGTSTIWSGLLEITGAAAVDSSSMPAPTVSFDSGSGYSTPKGDPLVMTLQLEIPASHTSNFVVEVNAPFSTTPVFQLCSLVISSVGANMPCLDPKKKQAVYSSRSSDSLYADSATLDMGDVTNLNIYSNTSANTVLIDVIVTPLEHVDVVDLSVHTVDVTVTYSNTKTVTLTESVTISGTTSTILLPNSTSPTFNMSYVYGDVYLDVGAATKVKLEMTTNRSVTYPLMNLEFIMPTGNSSAMFSVCRVKVESAGKNLPCATPEWISSNVEYLSRFNNDINDKAIMSLGAVCNYETEDNEEEDKLIVTFDVKLEDHDDLLHGTKEWVSAGNQYSDVSIWVGQLALFAQRGRVINPVTTPHISLMKNTTLSASPVGYPTIFTLLIKVPPQEDIQLKVVVTSTQDGLYVCGIRIKDTGDNLPCVNKSTSPTFTQFSGGGNDVGTLDVGIVSNTGSDALISNDNYDSNTLLVELIMKFSDDTTLVTNAGSYTFNAHVQYSSTGLKTEFNGHAIASTHDTTLANLTTVQSSATCAIYTGELVGNDSDTVIAKGESKRVLLNVVLPPGEIQQVTVKFLTSVLDVDQMEICDAAIVHVGSSFPCLDKTNINQTIEKRPGSKTNNVVTFNLGFQCSSTVNPSDTEANKITFESVVRLLPTTTKLNGETIPFHAAVNTNDIEIYVVQYNFTVSDTFEETSNSSRMQNETLLTVNVTDSVIQMGIGAVTTFPVVLTIPTMTSSRVLFDVHLPINGTAVAVVNDIRFVSSGVNIGCLYESASLRLAFTKNYNSSLDNCEYNRATLDLGIVTNSGLSYRKGTYSEGDNNIYLEVDITMLDSEAAENGAQFLFSFGAKIDSTIVIYDKAVSVQRDSTEKPELQLTATVNSSLSTSTNIVIDSILKHSNASSAKAINVSLFFYLPPYLQYKSYSSSSILPVSVTTDNGMVTLQFSELKFCDVIETQVKFEPNTSVTVPGDVMTDNTVIAYESGAQMIYRTGSSYTDGDFFSSDVQYVNFSTTVQQSSQCGYALGMADGIIDDCQLSGSIENNPANPPSHGRYNGDSAWCPFIRGEMFSSNRYFQVYFANRTLVTKVIIQIGSSFTHHPTELTFRYSDDGYAWQTGESVVVMPPYTEKTIFLTNLVEARILRVYIDGDDTPNNVPPDIGLKFEFYGCYKSSEYTPTNVCDSAPKTSYPNDFYFRSVLVANGKVFACDLNPQSQKLLEHCHSSLDGMKWTDVDKRVASLLGYDTLNNRIYAYDNDQSSTLMSTDLGVTWMTVPRDYYVEERLKSTFTHSKGVPWTATNLYVTTPDPSYQISNYGATFTGLWKNTAGSWDRVIEWDSCCK